MVRTLLRGAGVFLAAVALWADGNFALHRGDTVVFYGDSITDQRLYTTFVETFAVTRFPQLQVRFIHSGWGGDRVSGGGGGPIDLRLRRDVFPFKPSVVTIMLGMNDGGYRPYDAELFTRYSTGYENIVQAIKTASPGVRITAIKPSPYDDITRPPKFEGGYNAVLLRYSQFLQQLAAKENLTLSDFNGPVVEMLRKAHATDPETSEKILPDRVHPGPGGHLIMAEQLLKSWNAPSVVSDVEIDAASGHIAHATNAEVTGVETKNGLRWSQTDRSLPMPINWKDETLALAVHSSDFVDALDHQMLKVTSLPAGTYTLNIDGSPAGSFSSQDLANGINLVNYPTPMMEQAAEVHALTLKHNNIHFARWRTVQTPLDGSGFDTAQAESSLDALEDQVITAQRVAAQPKAHHFELVGTAPQG
jgi:lysophospholipase L1-like esterase